MEIVGWTHYTDRFKEAENTQEEINALIKELKDNGYVICGDEHDNEDSCSPVLSNGHIMHFSWRGWGYIMAQAKGLTGDYDYSLYYMKEVSPESSKLPKKYIDYSKIQCDIIHDIYLSEHDEEMMRQVKEIEYDSIFNYILPFNNYYKGEKVRFHFRNGEVQEIALGDSGRECMINFLCDYELRNSQYRDIDKKVALKILDDTLDKEEYVFVLELAI